MGSWIGLRIGLRFGIGLVAHWEGLVVFDEASTAVYQHPEAGVPYPGEVLFWIVCKGTTTTSTSSTTTSSTTSTSSPTSTTTITQATTTTEREEPSTTTTTIPYDSTTTLPSTTTPIQTTVSSTAFPTTSTLPFTGPSEDLAGIAVGLVLWGGLILLTMQSSRRFSKE